MSFLASCPQSCQGRAPPRSSIQPVMLQTCQQHTVSAATTYSPVTRPAEEQSTNFQVHVGLFHIQSARASLFLSVDFFKAKRACLSTAEQSHEIRRQQQANAHASFNNIICIRSFPQQRYGGPVSVVIGSSCPWKQTYEKAIKCIPKRKRKQCLSFTPSGDIGRGGVRGGGGGGLGGGGGGDGLGGGGGGDGLGGGGLGGGGAAAVKGEEQGHSSSAAMHAKQGFHRGGVFEANVAAGNSARCPGLRTWLQHCL